MQPMTVLYGVITIFCLIQLVRLVLNFVSQRKEYKSREREYINTVESLRNRRR